MARLPKKASKRKEGVAIREGAYISPPTYARQLGVKADKVLSFIKSGQLRAIDFAAKLGGRPRYRLAPADIAAFEARRAFVAKPHSVRIRRKQAGEVIDFF